MYTFCTRKQINKKMTFIPIEPQPDQNSILTVHRIYNKNKIDNNYRRRVTWMTGQTNNNVALVEYTGTYPGAQPHGNSKYKNAAEYQRSRPVAIGEQCMTTKPDKLFTAMTKANDELNRPRDTRQIINKRQQEGKKRDM